MMKIKIICIGSIKEKFFRDAIDEYDKRLSRFCKLEIVEIKEERLGDNPSQADIEKTLNKEKDKILSSIDGNSFTVDLSIQGKMLDSEALAKKIGEISLEGYSEVNFIIGSSHGLDDEIRKSSNLSLSFSKMTFPHQLMRVVLLEQIYRAFKINANEAYHK